MNTTGCFFLTLSVILCWQIHNLTKFGLNSEKDGNILIILPFISQEKRYVVYISIGDKCIFKKIFALSFFNFYQCKEYF